MREPAAERYVTTAALPSPYDRELLTILIEECAEVAQRATKLLRFGAAETQPGQPLNNVERLSEETGDLRCMLALLQRRRLISGGHVAVGFMRKRSQLAKFMQEQPESDA
jgi:NTP pyrophosphatase (non-canonical NTP hydrolase)